MKRKKGRRPREHVNNKGFSLVEMLISLAILGIILVPLMGNFIRSMRLNKKSESIQVQSNLAASVMEGLKAFSIEDIINMFHQPKNPNSIDLIPNKIDGVGWLDKGTDTDYIEFIPGDEEDLYKLETYYFVIHEVEAGDSSYDVLIRLDAIPYQDISNEEAEDIQWNDYLMPEMIKLNSDLLFLFSDASSPYGASEDSLDERALLSFEYQGREYAKSLVLKSDEYRNYLNSYDKWRMEYEVALSKNEPLPPEPRFDMDAAIENYEFTNPDKIKQHVKKNMKVKINTINNDDGSINNLIRYEIEYECEGWSYEGKSISPMSAIIEPVGEYKYGNTLENIYLFYDQSIFHVAHGEGLFTADRIHLYNETMNEFNFFLANQEDIEWEVTFKNPVYFHRKSGDLISIFTNIDTNDFVSYIDGREDNTVNLQLIKTYKLNRIFDITIDIYKSDSSNRYEELLYTLSSTKER